MPTLRSRNDWVDQGERPPKSAQGTEASQPRILLPRVGETTEILALLILRPLGRTERAQCKEKLLDGCQTDPEPGMDSRRATVRNMRSKCRCSCVLQFTFRRAVSCVLHRPPSQVIHCIVLCFQVVSVSRALVRKDSTKVFSHPIAGRLKDKPGQGRRSLWRSTSRLAVQNGAPHPKPEPEDGIRTTDADRADTPWQPRAGEPEARGKTQSSTRGLFRFLQWQALNIDNDPSAGSPTETLLRLLLPLNAQVWESSRTQGRRKPPEAQSKYLTKTFNR